MRRKRKTYHFQYGLAILFLLFVITGITKGLQGEQKQEVVQELMQEDKAVLSVVFPDTDTI